MEEFLTRPVLDSLLEEVFLISDRKALMGFDDAKRLTMRGLIVPHNLLSRVFSSVYTIKTFNWIEGQSPLHSGQKYDIFVEDDRYSYVEYSNGMRELLLNGSLHCDVGPARYNRASEWGEYFVAGENIHITEWMLQHPEHCARISKRWDGPNGEPQWGSFWIHKAHALFRSDDGTKWYLEAEKKPEEVFSPANQSDWLQVVDKLGHIKIPPEWTVSQMLQTGPRADALRKPANLGVSLRKNDKIVFGEYEFQVEGGHSESEIREALSEQTPSILRARAERVANGDGTYTWRFREVSGADNRPELGTFEIESLRRAHDKLDKVLERTAQLERAVAELKAHEEEIHAKQRDLQNLERIAKELWKHDHGGDRVDYLTPTDTKTLGDFVSKKDKTLEESKLLQTIKAWNSVEERKEPAPMAGKTRGDKMSTEEKGDSRLSQLSGGLTTGLKKGTAKIVSGKAAAALAKHLPMNDQFPMEKLSQLVMLIGAGEIVERAPDGAASKVGLTKERRDAIGEMTRQLSGEILGRDAVALFSKLAPMLLDGISNISAEDINDVVNHAQVEKEERVPAVARA